ncbi:MAG: aminopeptidase P family protein [Spirochaetaceae bacterium]|jgi:Xaa-Pro aminopeptidase|nr:aminopeptidase P family protein [Spirochaetaceae bacterium]
MNSEDIAKIQGAIREEGLDGWLFCNFRHRDRLSDELLERPPGLSNSRFWFYAVPASGEPEGLVHAVETDHLQGLPGTKKTYVSREHLLRRLKVWGGKRWGVHASETISALSYLDAGTYGMLAGAGLRLCSAEGLIQRFKGRLDQMGIAAHERAAGGLYRIVETVWDFVRSSYDQKKTIYEGDLRQIMEDGFLRHGLVRDHPPLAAAGSHSANPHYDFEGPGAPLAEGDLIQLDLWAKEKTGPGIYADISWVGFYGKKPEPPLEKIFADLAEAREGVLRFIEDSLASGRALSGAGVDQECRALLIAGGYEGALKHRTGHGIDTECHGCGVNLDSVEFADPRPLLEGSCFSVEPGIYLVDRGLRTEVNVIIRGGRPLVSGPGREKQGRQFKLLHC